jgi:hypothetical protein
VPVLLLNDGLLLILLAAARAATEKGLLLHRLIAHLLS